MQTPYRAVDFVQHDIITRDALDQIQNNLQYIKDMTPRGRFYNTTGAPSDVRTVIVAGRSLVKRNKKRDTATVKVRLSKAFAPDCRPNVTTGVVSDFQTKIYCTVSGPKSVVVPTANGFDITVNIAADKARADYIRKNFFVHWHAFGYRTDDMNEF